MNDTIELLKECDAGTKMAIGAIEDVLSHIDSTTLERILKDSREEHSQLSTDIHIKLNEYGEGDKAPSGFVKGMSRLKIGVRLSANESDSTVADLITDGCNMGIKTVHRYINKYHGANPGAVDLAKKLINLEEDLRLLVAPYL